MKQENRSKNTIRRKAMRKYERAIKKLSRTNKDNQSELRHEIHDNFYRSICETINEGQAIGACLVSFECQYDVHVSRYVTNELQKRQDDENDKLIAFAIDDVKYTSELSDPATHTANKNNRLLLTIVSGDDIEGCMLAARACAMAALSRLCTLCGQIWFYEFELMASGAVHIDLNELYSVFFGNVLRRANQKEK